MGGHHGGAQASVLAVRTIHDEMLALLGTVSPRDALAEAIRRANQAIHDAARRHHRLMGMGTTVAAVVICDDDTAHVAHVGDSRVYLIRGGAAKPLTRDHTMVNLFVEAELLSPEDAASHPEAHVLSRSLGIERTVDVELHDPVSVEYGDAFVVCSDGVHGAANEHDFATNDWADPDTAVAHMLDIVDARGGDDNATVVAAVVGEFEGEPSASTVLPELDLGRADEEESAVAPPPAPSFALTANPTLVDVPLTPPPTPERFAEPEPIAPPVSQTPAPAEPNTSTSDVRSNDSKAPKEAKRSRRSPLMLIAVAAVAFIGLGVAGVAVLGLAMAHNRTTDGPVTVIPADPDIALVTPPSTSGLPADPTVPATDPTAADPALIPPRVPFVVTLPEEPRRAPHRAERYLQPPPGGTSQLEAVKAAREHRCAESLDTIVAAMRISSDHVVLYPQAWTCFNETHQKVLLHSHADAIGDFAPLLEHFQGAPPAEEPAEKLPEWYRPATDGIEARLAAFDVSDDADDLFAASMRDKLGGEVIADHLARDLYIEASAAAGLSQVPDQTDEQTGWWARRVYIVTKSLSGPVGKEIKASRPDAYDGINALLMDSVKRTDPALLDAAAPVPGIPDPVHDAWRAGRGLQLPTATAGAKKPPKPPVVYFDSAPVNPTTTPDNPTDTPVDPNNGEVKIHRSGRP